MEASVLVMRCGASKQLFGVRIQKMDNGDWYRTWAFKLNERLAKNEGYDQAAVTGSLTETKEFPGCPYCGSHLFYQCGTCRKIVCWNGNDQRVTCPWCGVTADMGPSSNSFTFGTDAF